jgi:20S proteasome alpha/beta subunit
VTLVLGKRYNEGIIVATDSRMVFAPRGTVLDVDDHYQKVFPLTKHAVIGFSAKNIGPTALTTFGNVIKDELSKKLKPPFTIKECADVLADEIRKNKNTNFQPDVLIAGYDLDSEGDAIGDPRFCMVNNLPPLDPEYKVRMLQPNAPFASTNTIMAASADRASDRKLGAVYDKTATIQVLYDAVKKVSEKNASVGGDVMFWDITKASKPVKYESEREAVGEDIELGSVWPV